MPRFLLLRMKFAQNSLDQINATRRLFEGFEPYIPPGGKEKRKSKMNSVALEFRSPFPYSSKG